ncbi:MAG: sulfotransferase [Proteobacteria bacterium]|nr:sulfotransferase [Pseudomonadota bacterium]
MKTQDSARLPDFIIIGAMKSGTTSIHHILGSHDDVFMPEKETYFFDVDDIEQHGDFFIKTKSGWTFHDYEKDFDTYFPWYQRFFAAAASGQVIGEDTTTYLASPKAPGRIAKLLPKAKLVAVLRDPVARAYSHYWHNMAAGRVTKSFEKTIQQGGGNLLARGFYEDHLRRYEQFLKAGRLKVILFEDFLSDKQGTTDALCAYLGLGGTVDVATVDSHKNVASVPLIIPLRYVGNWLYRFFASNLSNRNIPNMPAYDLATVGATGKGARWTSRIWRFYRSRLPSRRYPPMRPETRLFLEKLFKKKNAGLSEFIGVDVSARWPYMK